MPRDTVAHDKITNSNGRFTFPLTLENILICYSDQTRKASNLKKGGCLDLKKREEFLKQKNMEYGIRRIYGKLSRN